MCILLVPDMTVFILLRKVPHIVTIKSFGRGKNETNKQTNQKQREGQRGERERDRYGGEPLNDTKGRTRMTDMA